MRNLVRTWRIQRVRESVSYIIEKYGCFFIRGSFILSAGFLWSSCNREVMSMRSDIESVEARMTHAANQALRVLIHRPVFGELQLVL